MEANPDTQHGREMSFILEAQENHNGELTGPFESREFISIKGRTKHELSREKGHRAWGA
jgi:hypothetical protein